MEFIQFLKSHIIEILAAIIAFFSSGWVLKLKIVNNKQKIEIGALNQVIENKKIEIKNLELGAGGVLMNTQGGINGSTINIGSSRTPQEIKNPTKYQDDICAMFEESFNEDFGFLAFFKNIEGKLFNLNTASRYIFHHSKEPLIRLKKKVSEKFPKQYDLEISNLDSLVLTFDEMHKKVDLDPDEFKRQFDGFHEVLNFLADKMLNNRKA